MGKILGLITGIKLPSLGTMIVIGVVLSVLGSVGFLGYDYSQRGNEIEALKKEKADELIKWQNEKKIWIREQLSISAERDSVAVGLRQAQADRAADSVNFAEREAQMQLTIRDVRKKAQDGLRQAQADTEKAQAEVAYWKDYADKLESGDYEVKMGVWPFRGKKLVKKSPPAPSGGVK